VRISRFRRQTCATCCAFSLEQRRRLVEAIWRVVYSDGVLSAVENQLARRIGELLGLQHPDIQAARERVLAQRRAAGEAPV
jgi:uncharacterized tellurite resistance protein B-like protein